jgi:hypothetical protein
MILVIVIVVAVVFVGGVLVAKNNIPFLNNLFSLFGKGPKQ